MMRWWTSSAGRSKRLKGRRRPAALDPQVKRLKIPWRLPPRKKGRLLQVSTGLIKPITWELWWTVQGCEHNCCRCRRRRRRGCRCCCCCCCSCCCCCCCRCCCLGFVFRENNDIVAVHLLKLVNGRHLGVSCLFEVKTLIINLDGSLRAGTFFGLQSPDCRTNVKTSVNQLEQKKNSSCLGYVGPYGIIYPAMGGV